ncbi:MAG: amino acid-binding protein [Myxococcales bacterium]
MRIRQLSVFLENTAGRLSAVCDALASEGLSLSSLCLADTEKFGILRLLLSDWERAKEVLERRGYVVAVTDVVATVVADEAGSLARMLGEVERAGIGVEYMYGFTVKASESAVMVLRFDRTDEAISRLLEARVHVMSSVELFERATLFA